MFDVPLPDYSLNATEMAFFKTNGFVVSERLASSSFADIYHGVFFRDLPVFVTSDSILHAWHRSYDAMLSQLEEAYLYDSLSKFLDALAAQVPAAVAAYGRGPLEQSVADADYMLTVARSLLTEGWSPTVTGQDAKVLATINAIDAGNPAFFDLFGRGESHPGDPSNLVDFSLFKVRGHYTASPRLGRYFRCMIWCGHIDLRIAGNPDESSPREMGTALVLRDLAARSGQLPRWQDIDAVIRLFVGPTDSLNLLQIDTFVNATGFSSPTNLTSLQDLQTLQARLADTQLGTQLIQGDNYVSAMDGSQLQLPRSFTLLGQRFVPDSWLTSELVFDRIPAQSEKERRIPSALDVAFGVLANNAAVPWLVNRMQNAHGLPFRDGVPYQTNLAALRMVFDSVRPESLDDNLYNGWLAALTTLSAPTVGPEFPAAMRTHAWAMKTLNTQLASWTQLRHDTIAYVKQSGTTTGLCSYPAGFVEPLPALYRRLGQMATNAALRINALPMSGTNRIFALDVINFGGDVDLGQLKINLVHFLGRFSQTMATLESISREELLSQPLKTDEADFLKNIVEMWRDYVGLLHLNGWYPGLFYKSNEGLDPRLEQPFPPSELILVHDSIADDRLVADVHTDAPDETVGDPGAVLHEGVGNVHFMMIAVDNGPDRMVYAGPVFSHFEFLEPYGVRLNDSLWRVTLDGNAGPAQPQWTREYLVPKPGHTH